MRTGFVTVGMPQMNGVGLSETWLLERCGELHWELVSEYVGKQPTDLVDSLGRRVYASFVAIDIKGAPFHCFREGEQLRHASRLVGSWKTRIESDHSWQGPSGCVAVRMLSVFLIRKDERLNDLAEPSAEWLSKLQRLPQSRNSDLELAFRSEERAPTDTHLPMLSFRPTLALDFNGARLLYFARYHQFIERAETELLGEETDQCYSIKERSLLYFSNINPGESVSVSFSSLLDSPTERKSTADLVRTIDRKLLARVTTVKQRVNGVERGVEAHHS
jgi:probable biosynthetic protein (TIGR04099 family)